MAESAGLGSAKRWARIAGLCYLAVIAGGLFAEGAVREQLIVADDAAATARKIAGSESLWQWGYTVHLLYLLAATAMAAIVYGLFKPVDAMLARLALVFAVVDVTIEAMSLLNLTVPLALEAESGALATLDDGQREDLGYLATHLFSSGFAIGLTFFAGFCVLTGVLILRSSLLPRAIGALMALAGVCYLVNSVAYLNSASLSEALVPWILLPPLLGELSLALWLALKGVAARDPMVAPA